MKKRQQCQGKTKVGEQCKLNASYGKSFCHHHLPLTAISDVPHDNIRENLTDLEETRATFVGKFKRVGSKPGGYLTILLTDIFSTSEPDKIISDHSWFNFTKGFKELNHLNEGDLIQFTARVKRYEKSDKTFDYKFSLPLSVKRYTKP